jgi:1,4-dihydroxy-6-naphthoate synthase
MKLTIGFSPCPNDTFIFDAMINGLIDTPGFEWEPVLEDVETLNRWALDGKLDITKISYGVLADILPQYGMLNSGGAMGMGVGPLLITSKENSQLSIEALSQLPVAIPGEHTTAHLLMSYALPSFQNKSFSVFHEIEDAILSGSVGTGVIIHENRFTYAAKELQLVNDLGSHWEQSLHCPIPLGGIAMRRSFPAAFHQKINAFIKMSLEYARRQLPTLGTYVQLHAQEMEEEVQRKHIELYVNEYSTDAGIVGKNAVTTLLEVQNRLRSQQHPNPFPIFLL